MTSYRLWPSTNGPTTAVALTGNFISGLCFTLTDPAWFEGYWWWVAASQGTDPVKCALWAASPAATTGGIGNVLVPGSVVTSGTLSAGWNWIPLDEPIQLAPGFNPTSGMSSANSVCYVAEVGCNGAFPDTNGFWATDPVQNGPLYAYHGNVGSAGAPPYNMPQGVFTQAGSDPATTFANQSSSTDNFWVDVQVTDTAPADWDGTTDVFAGWYVGDANTDVDDAVAYVVGTEVDFSAEADVLYARYFVPSGAAGFATKADLWDIGSQTSVASITSPVWLTDSGATAVLGAKGQWVKCAFPDGTTVPSGNYRISVYKSDGGSGGWNAKSVYGYWTVGPGANGITRGIISAPGFADAQLVNVYEGSGTTGGQPCFTATGTDSFPNEGTGETPPQNYLVGAVVRPHVSPSVTVASVAAPATSSVAARMASTGSAGSVAAPGAGSATGRLAFTASGASMAAPGAGSASIRQAFAAVVASLAAAGVSAGLAGGLQPFTAVVASVAAAARSAVTVLSVAPSVPNYNPWFEAELTDTLTRQRGSTNVDAYGNTVLDFTSPDEATFPVRVAPPIIKTRLGSHAADEDMDGRDAIRYDLEAWLATDDVTALDRCVYQGKTYEVTGEPGNRTDSDGYYMYSKILLREVAG